VLEAGEDRDQDEPIILSTNAPTVAGAYIPEYMWQLQQQPNNASVQSQTLASIPCMRLPPLYPQGNRS
jgi:hypothetical protein